MTTSTQIPPVGTHPDADTLFIAALWWADPADAAEILQLVCDDDVASPHLTTVLARIRAMTNAREPISPQLVLDKLLQHGMNKAIQKAIEDATTCGAATGLLRDYAAAVVARALRRRIESAGYALTVAAEEAAEEDLPVLTATIAKTCDGAAHRLAALRGEVVNG